LIGYCHIDDERFRFAALTPPEYLLPQISQVAAVGLSAIHLEHDSLHGPLPRSLRNRTMAIADETSI
jgi:hypothetical protein